MSTVLLNTKIHIPVARFIPVVRARLLERLNAGLDVKLTLVSAPAGFGKTTLVGSWAKNSHIPTAWLSLDSSDNDGARFWTYFIGVLQTIDASIGEDFLAIPDSSEVYASEVSLTSLLNEIGEIQTSFAFILDDYHVIEDRQIQEGVMFLVENLPPNMHMFLCTRVDPPWPLARLRARHELIELRADDLRFTPQETAEFLEEIMGLSLSAEQIALLDTRTEGWIAGLQMAALSMQGRQDKTEFIRTFSGSHRFILDYLMDEVIDRQSAEVQDFLLRTSILERMTAPLCDAVLGRTDSGQILDQIEKANLFLIPLDDERRWYRYHHLFADLLHSSLMQKWPDQIDRLHLEASRWFAENDMISEAIDHAFSARDLEQVAHLVEESALTIITVYNDQLPDLVSWLDALPEELSRSRPWLKIARAWALAYLGDLHTAEMALQDAERIFLQPLSTSVDIDENRERERIAGHIAVIRSYQALQNKDTTLAIELAKAALKCLPEDDVSTRGFAAIILAAASGISGDLDGGVRVLSEAANTSRKTGDHLFSMMILCELAGLQILQGQLRQVIATCEEALQLASIYAKHRGQQPPIIGFALARLSYVLRERNDLAAAIQYAQQAVKTSGRWGQKDSLCISYVYLALGLQAAGNNEDAHRAIRNARHVAAGFSTVQKAHVVGFEVKIRSFQNDLPFLSRWAEENGLNVEDDLHVERMREYIALARVLMAQGKTDKALQWLSRLLHIVESAGAMLYGIEMLILQALALQARGEMDPAIAALVKALSLAEPEGYVRVFIDEGERMRVLLRQMAARGIAADYVSKLLTAFETSATSDGVSAKPFVPTRGLPEKLVLADQLTDREIEVLKMLTTRLSIMDIASRLYISVATLRTHIKHIYEKLETHSRIETIARAHELGLL